MSSLKKDFPLLDSLSDTIYLDSASTLQKPRRVIDGVSTYLSTDYANIHRGLYTLSESSEDMYRQTRRTCADFLGCNDDEIIFTSNSTSASNLIVGALKHSKIIQDESKIISSKLEHHAHIVPRQIHGCKLDRIELTPDQSVNRNNARALYSPETSAIALTLCSNVTGEDLYENIKSYISWIRASAKKAKIPAPFIMLDASQSVAHRRVDVKDLDADACFFTGHKIGAHTGIGVCYLRKEYTKSLTPAIGGGGAIASVSLDHHTLITGPDKREPGTPNLVGAKSLLEALLYLQELGEDKTRASTYKHIHDHEAPLITYCNRKFRELEEKGYFSLTGPTTNKAGVYSFMLLNTGKTSTQLGQYMADRNICIRCGSQCAHPLHEALGNQTCRISFRAYNDLQDLEGFFGGLEERLEL